MQQNLLYLKSKQNQQKAEREPGQTPKTAIEKRLDWQLGKLLDVIDAQEERIAALEKKLLLLITGLRGDT